MSKILCLRPRLPAFEIIISDVETLQEDYLYFNEIGNDLCQILLSIFPLEDIYAILFAFKSENKKESEMAKEVEILFQQLNIPFYCCSWKSVLVTATFLACIAEYGNEEMFEDKIDFIYCFQNRMHIFNLVKCGRYYRIQAGTYATLDQIYDAKYVKAKKVFITILKEIPVGDISKQKITLSMVINALAPTKDLVIINKSVHDFTTHGIVTIVPHTPNILNQLYSKYAVLQTSQANYFVIPAHRLSCVTPDKYKNESLISITTSEMIHVEKSIICYEEIDNIRFVDDTPHDDLIKLVNCGTFKIGTMITLKIDKFFMPQMEVTREYDNLIKNGVIINLERNTFSIEIILDGILFNVTDFYNFPLVVRYVDGNILVGNEALEAQREHYSSIITDLMLFLTTPFDSLKFNANWEFTVAKYNNNQIHLEFNTANSPRSISPANLLSSVIRWSVIKAENSIQQPLDTLIIATKLLDEELKQQIQTAVKNANLSVANIQIQKYKIFEI